MLCYESIAVTDIGNKRKVNQDSYIEIKEYINNKYVGLFCVADGMGGLSDGEYASNTATQMSIQWYRKNIDALTKKRINEKKLNKELKRLFYEINEKIYVYGKQKNIKLGTTYSLLLILNEKYYVVHAGDSRIYMKRNEKLFLLTKDQTLVNDLVDRGLLTKEQAVSHPKKNVLANCIGCFENPCICIGSGNLDINDKFLLCSDGLYNLMTADEIFTSMENENMDCIYDMLSLVKKRGGFDNITILIVKAVNLFDIEATTVNLGN